MIFNIGCKKYSYNESQRAKYNKALKEVELGCSENISILYFSAQLNGKEVCYHDGFDGYFAKSRNTSYTLTNGPTLSTGDDTSGIVAVGKFIEFGIETQPGHLRESFMFMTPIFTSELSHNDIAERYFKKGALPLAQNLSDNLDGLMDSSGFNIYMSLPYQEGRVTAFTEFRIESRLGDQSDSKLEIVSLNKFHQNGKDYYDMELEFECNLYHRPYLKANTFYGRLENGKMRILIEE